MSSNNNNNSMNDSTTQQGGPTTVVSVVANNGSNPFWATPEWAQIKNSIAGTASGMANTLAGHPFDTLKVRLQTEGVHGRFKGPLHCLTMTIKEEGLLGLYKGVTPPLFGMGIINSAMFGSFHWTKKVLSESLGKPMSQLSLPEIMVCGTATGVIVSLVVCPVEQIKARLQVQYIQPAGTPLQYKGPIDCARQLIRNNGIMGLFNGFQATVMTRAHCYAYFGGYTLAERYFMSRKKDVTPATTLQVWEKFIAGGVAGSFYWLSCYPFDVVKNRMMSQPDVPLEQRKYKSALDCFRKIYVQDGLRGFYKGFVPAALRTFPANGATFVAFAFVMEALP